MVRAAATRVDSVLVLILFQKLDRHIRKSSTTHLEAACCHAVSRPRAGACDAWLGCLNACSACQAPQHVVRGDDHLHNSLDQ